MTTLRTLLLSFIALLAFTSPTVAQTSTKGVGFTNQSTIPWSPCPTGTSCMWVNTSTKQVQFFDGTSAKTLPSVITSTKGDMAVFNGSIWVKVAAGSDGQCLTAQSGTSSGVEWDACGSGGETLAQTYALGTTTADSIMSIDNTRGPVVVKYALTGTTATEGHGLLFSGTPLSSLFPGSGVAEYSSLAEFRQSYGQTNDPESGYLTARMALQGRMQPNISSLATTNRLAVLSDNGTGTYSEVASFGNTGSLVTPSVGTSTSALHAFPSGTGALVSTDAAQTLSGPKTLTAPVINGYTSSGSTSMDASGNSGTQKTTTGVFTFLSSAINAAAAITNTILAIGTAQTAGFTLANTTPATTGAEQYSPVSWQYGTRYSGSASKTVGWGWQAQSIGDGTDAGEMALYSSYDGTPSKKFSIRYMADGVILAADASANSTIRLRSTDTLWCTNGTNTCIGMNYDISQSIELVAGGVIVGEINSSFMGPRVAYGITGGSVTRPYSLVGMRHVEFVQAAKPTCAVGAAAGTGSPSCTVTTNSTDQKGIVTVTLGTTPTANATIVTVTFTTAYTGSSTRCNVTPANADAANNLTAMPFAGTTTSTTLPLTTPAVAYTTGAPAFAWDCDGSTSN